MRSVHGAVLKALFMSIVVRSAMYVGLGTFRSSCKYLFSDVMSEVDECRTLEL